MPDIVHLADSQSGAVASIAPELGFNCFRFAVPYEGKLLEVLWSAPNFAAGTERPSGSGIPLMFPFAGRIRGTSFAWEGVTYELEEGDGLGNAIHGFVMRRPWRVVRQSANSVTGEFQASVDDPALLRRWPADFRIAATYTVTGMSLEAEYRCENPGERPLPFAFGTHAYFRVPLGGKSAADCRLVAQVDEQWELKDMIPTGQHEAVGQAPEFAAGLPLGALKFDAVFSGRFSGGNASEAAAVATKVIDPQSGVTLTQTCTGRFPFCVIYTPPHREAVCLEPYTSLPDYFRLARAGVNTGLEVIPPGGTSVRGVTLSVTPAGTR